MNDKEQPDEKEIYRCDEQGSEGNLEMSLLWKSDSSRGTDLTLLGL